MDARNRPVVVRARPPDRSYAVDREAEGYTGGESVWLAWTEDGWVVVDTGAWIT